MHELPAVARGWQERLKLILSVKTMSLLHPQLIGKIMLIGAVTWGTKKFQAVPSGTIIMNILQSSDVELAEERL